MASRPFLRSRLVPAFALAALALVLFAASAAALVPIRTNTTITLAPLTGNTVAYSGKLTTKLSKGTPTPETRRAARRCLRNRAVEIESDLGEIATTSTNSKGVWSVTGKKPVPNSNPRVVIARDVRGNTLCGVRLKHFTVSF